MRPSEKDLPVTPGHDFTKYVKCFMELNYDSKVRNLFAMRFILRLQKEFDLIMHMH
jgi:hypothetical protein